MERNVTGMERLVNSFVLVLFLMSTVIRISSHSELALFIFAKVKMRIKDNFIKFDPVFVLWHLRLFVFFAKNRHLNYLLIHVIIQLSYLTNNEETQSNKNLRYTSLS